MKVSIMPQRKVFYFGMTALFAALLTAAAFLVTFIVHDGQILLHGDFVTQQVPFLLENRRMILSGTPFWSWNTFLGANFLGSYSFYAYGSPFFWPLLLVPASAMTYGITAMFFAKQIVAAVGGYLFFSNYVKNQWHGVLGGLIYAFSFFSLDSSFYYHFMDIIALFPFFLWALDRILTRKKGGTALFTVSVFVLAVANYYFFVAICVFFLIYLFFQWRHNQAAPKNLRFYFGVIALYGCAALAASFILLPSAFTLLETTKAKDAFGEVQNYLAVFPQIPILIKDLIMPHESINYSALYFQYTDYCSNAGFVPLFGAVFFYIGLKRWPKVWENKLLRFLLILTLLPYGNAVFSLFSNLMYTRWWFMLVLVFILVTLRTIERMQVLGGEETAQLYRGTVKFFLKLSFWITVPFVLLRVLLAYVVGDIFPPFIQEFLTFVQANKPYEITDLKYLLLLLFLLAVNYLPLLICVKKNVLQKGLRLVLVGMVVCVLNCQAYLAVNEGYLWGPKVIPQTSSVESAMASYNVAVSNANTYEYRTDIIATPNAAMQVNRPGMDTFHSIKSNATAAFGRRIGYGISIYPDTPRYFNTHAIYALLSVKNTMTLQTGKNGEKSWLTTENEAYTPMGFSYDYYLIDDSQAPAEPSEDLAANNEKIETMVKACYLDSETAAKLQSVIAECPQAYLETDWRSAVNENRKNACESFAADASGFTAKATGEKARLIYFSVPHDNGWNAFINGEAVEIYTVNYGMMGVVVPAGEAEIRFVFETPGLKLGAAVSITMMAGMLLAGMVWLALRKRKNRQI